MLFNCVNQVLAGALRGRGDSVAPMVIMLFSFVLIRQIYLFCHEPLYQQYASYHGFWLPRGLDDLLPS